MSRYAYGSPALMSFLHDALLSRRYHSTTHDSEPARNRLSRSSSHAGLLSPLVKLVKDPAGILEDFVGGLGGQDHPQNAPELEDGSRKQILYLRLQNVSRRTSLRMTFAQD